jgi:PAS domain S-box-containing protein
VHENLRTNTYPRAAAAEFSQRVRNAQGSYRWFLSRAEPLRASDGTLLQWVGVNLEIEELKYAEQALRESEYKLRQIIETVPGHIWSTDPDGEPTHINQRLLDYSGMRLEDFKQRGWEAFVHPADFPETAKAFHHAIQTGISYQSVHRLRRSDGEYRCPTGGAYGSAASVWLWGRSSELAARDLFSLRLAWNRSSNRHDLNRLPLPSRDRMSRIERPILMKGSLGRGHETHTEVVTKETDCICLEIGSQALGIIKEI